eukprot:TRINITY_DN3017_c4_g1_i1.p1 TRINITY_DN3017_c4_g1~~TRINITY_DN3017_c4_g1_i1.p1  ORF type:complete len:775 (-),score=157.33 TRINITY_DN3017_c4_g1_i1:262-2586(-)
MYRFAFPIMKLSILKLPFLISAVWNVILTESFGWNSFRHVNVDSSGFATPLFSLDSQESKANSLLQRDSIRRKGQRLVSNDQLSWPQARAKALKTVSKLTEKELRSLVRGSHFSFTGLPEAGYYIGNTEALPQHHLPALKMQDAGQGFRTTEAKTEGTTTAWPCLLALAATWSPKLVRTVAEAIGQEFKGKGANVLLGPSINVHRGAAAGRNFEYLSGEDPYLGSILTRAYVEGVQSQGVMAVAKHFAFNEQERDRMSEDSFPDERTAKELYYPPFQAAVDAGVASFMCSYNKVNGTYACGNKKLLKETLRGSMGFQGFVMSDWTAMHKSSDLNAGLDMEMPGLIKAPVIGDVAVLTDSSFELVEDSVLKTAAANILTSMYKFRLDEDLSSCAPPHCDQQLKSRQTDASHRDTALKAASASITLLKNSHDLLPLNKSTTKTIAVLGRAAVDETHPYVGGGGSGFVPLDESALTPLKAIQKRASAEGVTVLTASTDTSVSEALKIAEKADVVVIIAGAAATEGADRSSLSLADDADELITGVASLGKLGSTATVVLMQTPGAILTPWRDDVESIANMFFGGVATGEAWANFLFGEPPKGRLPIMLPATEDDIIPIASSESVVYSEGLLTSYRSRKFKAAFPFGHGLTFTRFGYSKLEKFSDSENCDTSAAVCLKLTVQNIGQSAGEEIVQVYLHFPDPKGGGADFRKATPDMLLKSFKRTRQLKPNESEQLHFALSKKDISLYSSKQEGWVPQTQMEIRFGSSSGDIRQVMKLSM